MFGEWEITGVINGRLTGVRNAITKEELLMHWNHLKDRVERKSGSLNKRNVITE